MKRCRPSGFTLIEIIIVIVIIGILATLALPRITGQIESARAAEAMNIFGALRRSLINCIDMQTTTPGNEAAVGGNCDQWGELGMAQPQGAVFTYFSAYASPFMSFRANRGANSICININVISGVATFTVDPSTPDNPFFGAISRTGSYFAGACNAAGAM